MPTAATSPALWYLTRATGMVTLVLLTASVALGILGVQRWRSARWPRFLTGGLHRNVSLLSVAFLAVHVVTAVTDSFVTIRWVNVFIPFTGSYRPVWLGLGAVASDLLIALIITSLLRQRLGYQLWRATHWASYACWPLALVHGLGTGTDPRHGWALAVLLGSLAVVCAATWWRVGTAGRLHLGRRALGLGAAVMVPVAVLAWTVSGPLQPGWAARAGTPTAASTTTTVTPTAVFATPFTAGLAGTATQTQTDTKGDATITLAATVSGTVNGTFGATISGTAAAGGGVTMASSRATLGPASQPDLFTGRVTTLRGSQLVLTLSEGTTTIYATVNVTIDTAGNLTGTIQTSTTPPA